MKRRNRFFLMLLLVLLLAALIGGCGGDNVIKIGFSGQLSGVYSDLGVQGRNGVQLAVEELNEDGGVNGRKLLLLVENDKNNVKGAIEADRVLIDEGVMAIIGHMTSAQTLGVLPVVEEHNIPLISPTTSTPLLSGKKDLFFRLNTSSDRTAAVLGTYAYDELRARRVGLIYDLKNDAYSIPYITEFKKSFQQQGGEIVLQYTFSSDEDIQWKSILQLIQDKRVETVFLVASATDTAMFAQRIRESEPDMKIIGSGWAYTEHLLQYGGRAVEGIIVADSFYENNDLESFKVFQETYYDRFGRNPLFAASQGYESVLFLAEGLRRRAEFDGDLVAALQSIRNLQGLMGPLEFDEYGDVKRPHFFSEVKDGAFHLTGSIMDR